MTSSPRRPRVAFLLSQLGAMATSRFAAGVSQIGLSPGEAGVLRLLARERGLSQRALAERLGAVPSRVVVLIDGLEARDLVLRRRSPTDRRTYELHLTDTGTALLGRLRAVAEAHESAVLAPLTSTERQELGALLAKLSVGHALDPDVHPGQAST